MALPLLPTNLIHSVFHELSPSVLEINVLDGKETFYSNVEKQWIQAMDPKMLSVHGKFRRTNSEVEGFHSSFGKRAGRKRPNFWFFLLKLKSVGKAYQLEANQLREGIITRRYRRKTSKAADKFISKAEGKWATGRYTAQEFLQIVSHVTEKSFEKIAEEKKIRKILKMTCPLWPPTTPSNALTANAMKMRQTVQNVARVNWKNLIFVRNYVGVWCAQSALNKPNVWNATRKLAQNLQ